MDWIAKIKETLEPLMEIFSEISNHIKFYLNKMRFFLIFLLVAIIVGVITGFVTYWYKAIYEPQRELSLRETVSVNSIMSDLNVSLSSFALPKSEPNILEDEYIFSLDPQVIWEDELVDSLRLSSQDLGLNEIVSESNALMEKIISTL